MRRLVASGAERSLLWLRSPPLVTDLAVAQRSVRIQAAILSPDEVVGWWDATYLPFFMVASLGLVLAMPARNAPLRWTLLAVTLGACLLSMVGVTAVQVEAATVNYAHQRFGLRVFGEEELALARRASEAVNFVQLLVPAMAAFLAATAFWAAEASPGQTARRGWGAPALAWSLLIVLVLASLRPGPPPDVEALGARFARTLELNPSSTLLSTRLIQKMAIDPCGGLVLLRSVLRHLEDPSRHSSLRRLEPALDSACSVLGGRRSR